MTPNYPLPKLFHAFLAGLVYASTLFIFFYLYGFLPTAVLCALFALVNTLIARKLVASSFSTSKIVGVTLGGSALLYLLLKLITQQPWMAQIIGVPLAFELYQTLFSLVIIGALILIGRVLAWRHGWSLILELCWISTLLLLPFISHQGGYISRPRFMVDPLWAQGYDPFPFFLLLGACIGTLSLLLALSQSRKKGILLDLAIMMALLLALYSYLPNQVTENWIDPQQEDGGSSQQDKKEPSEEQEGKANPSGGEKAEMQFQSKAPAEPPKPVAVAIFRNDYLSPSEAYYFRQSALSHYNGKRMVKDNSLTYNQDVLPYFPSKKTTATNADQLSPLLKEVSMRIATMTNHTQPFALTSLVEYRPAQNPNPETFQQVYETVSHALVGNYADLIDLPVGDPQWDQKTREHYLEYPKDERYLKMAQQISETLQEEYKNNKIAQAIAIKLYLDEHGSYTLNTSASSSQDPTAEFLFGDMTGYCVHFSHAATYLFRSLDIPARVATGYAVEQANVAGSAALILSNDAHAWPEIYVQGLGWLPLDITPQTNLDQAKEMPDYDLQRILGELAREQSDEEKAVKQFDLRKVLRWLFSFTFYFISSLLGLSFVMSYLYKFWLRLAPIFFPKDPRHAYHYCLELLASGGLWRKRGETRLGFAQRVDQEDDDLSQITQTYYNDLFESSLSDKKETSRQELRNFRNNLKRKTTRTKRLLGLINPFTWRSIK